MFKFILRCIYNYYFYLFSYFSFYFIILFLFNFFLTRPSPENPSQSKEKHNTDLSEETAMGACPVKMGAISVPVLVQLRDSNILQRCPPRSENCKSKKRQWRVLTTTIIAPKEPHCDKQVQRYLLGPLSFSSLPLLFVKRTNSARDSR